MVFKIPTKTAAGFATAAMPHLPGADTNMLTSSIVSNLLKISIEARISPMVFCKKIQRGEKWLGLK